MNIKNISEEQKQTIAKAAKKMRKRIDNGELKTVERRELTLDDADKYIFELFGITENQDAQIRQLQQQIKELTAANEKLQQTLAVVVKVAQGQVDLKETVTA